jgi:3-methylcrotonyl-CoA carboxylase alpha subunit
MDRIIAAARETGAEAIHPGYGFPGGKPPIRRALRRGGHRVYRSRPGDHPRPGGQDRGPQIMVKGGVPVIPGMTEPETDPAVLAARAAELGYPVLIKAAAGGGGKGMRVVETPADLEGILQSGRQRGGRAPSATEPSTWRNA